MAYLLEKKIKTMQNTLKQWVEDFSLLFFSVRTIVLFKNPLLNCNNCDTGAECYEDEYCNALFIWRMVVYSPPENKKAITAQQKKSWQEYVYNVPKGNFSTARF